MVYSVADVDKGFGAPVRTVVLLSEALYEMVRDVKMCTSRHYHKAEMRLSSEQIRTHGLPLSLSNRHQPSLVLCAHNAPPQTRQRPASSVQRRQRWETLDQPLNSSGRSHPDPSPRAALFERLGLGDIRERLVTLDLGLLAEEQ
jgi:hypothetical protein